MDIIKKLNDTKIGMFIVVIFEKDLRCPSIYMGKDSNGIYTFMDTDHQYKLTPEYIKTGHISIDNELIDNELYEITSILDKIEKGV